MVQSIAIRNRVFSIVVMGLLACALTVTSVDAQIDPCANGGCVNKPPVDLSGTYLADDGGVYYVQEVGA